MTASTSTIESNIYDSIHLQVLWNLRWNQVQSCNVLTLTSQVHDLEVQWNVRMCYLVSEEKWMTKQD